MPKCQRHQIARDMPRVKFLAWNSIIRHNTTCLYSTKNAQNDGTTYFLCNYCSHMQYAAPHTCIIWYIAQQHSQLGVAGFFIVLLSVSYRYNLQGQSFGLLQFQSKVVDRRSTQDRNGKGRGKTTELERKWFLGERQLLCWLSNMTPYIYILQPHHVSIGHCAASNASQHLTQSSDHVIQAVN